MKKLTNSEINALAFKLHEELNGDIRKFNLKVKGKEEKEFYKSNNFKLYKKVEALIGSDIHLKNRFLVETLKNSISEKKASLSKDTVKNELIISQIESEDLKSLLQTVRNKFND